MAQGLVSTISIADDGKSDVLLITDGEIDGIDEVIEVAKKSSHRVFVVAIGSSPAEAHLRRLASATGGYCDFVAPGEDVEPAVLRMSARMRAARASGLRVQWPQDLKLRWAQRVQDYAFEDDALNVCAFADATDNEEHFGTAKLFGRIDGMEGEVLIAEAPLSLTQSTTNILARLTAFERYQELVREPTNRQLTQPVSSAQDLAVTYQLVSDQTNFLLVHERSEEEKAQEMPQAHHVPQMLAAGWGGTGSVARAMSRHAQPRQDVLSQADDCFDLDASEYPVLRTNSDYAAKSTPSVWRKSRTSAAAKVDAMSGSGMDDYEIPAFLRKQADDGPDLGALVRKGIDKLNSMFWKPKVAFGARPSRTDHGTGFVGITPAGMVQWLFTNDKSLWPKTFAELRDIGLDLSISEWLEFEIGEGQDEVDVVIAFLAVIRGYEFSPHTPQLRAGQAAQKKKGTSEKDKLAGQLETLIRAGLKGVTAQTWPSSVVNFPESIQS
jgi:Ca-activated chloride channel family protein